MKKLLTLVLVLGLVMLSAPQVRADDSTSSASVTNSVPVASSVVINSSTAIALTENTTTPVVINAVVTDNNGCEDIDSVNVKFFRTNIVAPAVDLVPSAYADNGSGLVRVTVGSLGTPALVTGNIVDIAGTTGSVYVGQWTVTVVGSDIDLQGSTYSVDPVAKGTVTPNAVKNGAMASDDTNNHYSSAMSVSGATCTTGGADLTADYTASISVQYYAEPTGPGSTYASSNWTAVVTPADGSGGTLDTDTEEVNITRALNVTNTIEYGAMALGSNTVATNQPTTITNTGNVAIDTEVDGYGTANDDTYSMICTPGNVPIGNEKYSTSDVTYASLTALSDTPTSLAINIAKATIPATPTTDLVYWGFAMPATGVNGNCQGTVVFTAI